MPVITKYKLSDLARDLKIPANDIIDCLTKDYGVKKASSGLNPDEVSYVLEYFTQKNQVDNFEGYFKYRPEKKPAKTADSRSKAENASKADNKPKAENKPKTDNKPKNENKPGPRTTPSPPLPRQRQSPKPSQSRSPRLSASPPRKSPQPRQSRSLLPRSRISP